VRTHRNNGQTFFVRGTAEKSPGIIVSLMGLREFQALRVEE
jgi:hypothetical protein